MNTTYFLNQIMGNVFHTNESASFPKSYYIGLSASVPTIDGVCDGEPSSDGTGYARVELTNLSEPDNGKINNSGIIEFPESIQHWGTMTYYIVYDSPTGGNLLFWGELEKSRVVEDNTIVVIQRGKLEIQLSNP